MSELQAVLDEYLAVRRTFGCQLRLPGALLRLFVRFLDEQGASFITTELALRWARQPKDAEPATWGNRLALVRRFAVYRSATDPRTEIPPKDLLPSCYRRKPPYIYADTEIRALLKAARGLPSHRGLLSWTYATVIGLLAVTGMRVSEVLALDREDVDLTDGVLTIRRTKFGKSRLVVVHSSTRDALRQYAERRDRILPASKSPAFFISERGTRLSGQCLRSTFAKISCQVGLRRPARSHGQGPRLHDFRHRFAVQTLLHWYRTDVDVERRIPELATYLGHGHAKNTYWYLSATPELLHLATLRIERAPGGRRP
jgi:integrase